jgi:dTDP-glucose 4,6-dehydratase
VRKGYLLVADAALVALAAVGAFVLRFDLRFMESRPALSLFVITALTVKPPLFSALGLYRRYWPYATATDFSRVAVAATATTLAIAIVLDTTAIVRDLDLFSPAMLCIDWLLTVVGAAGVRLAIRIRQESGIRGSAAVDGSQHRILVVGAGNAGSMVARLIAQNPPLPMRIVGFLDDDPAKQNTLISGHRVRGSRRALRRCVSDEHVDEVLVAMPSAPRTVIDDVCAECDRIGVLKRVIPGIPTLLRGTLTIGDVREWRSVIPAPTQVPHRLMPEQVFDRILVTGGAGFIGANFVRYWLDKYPSSCVVVLDKLTYAGNLDNLEGLDERYRGRYFFVHGDIYDKECVKQCIDDYGLEAIVNFAAESHVDRSLIVPDVFLQTNILGTQSLLDVVRQRPAIKRFHQVSTDEVYGEIPRGSVSEEDPLETRSPYSATKASADMLVFAYAASFGVSATITRGSNNIGPYQHPEKVVPLFVTSALDSEPLPVYGDGRYVRDYQYVLDHCAGIDIVLRRGAPGELYNLGGGTGIETIELARLIVRRLGRPESLIKLVTDRAGNDRRYSLNCAKVKALGWTPRFTLEQGLERTIAWYVDNEEWWRKIKRGEYRDYYHRQLKWRLEAAVGDTSFAFPRRSSA